MFELWRLISRIEENCWLELKSSDLQNQFLSDSDRANRWEVKIGWLSGEGLYVTDDIEQALFYAGPDGVVRIYDWSDGPGELSMKLLEGVEWEQFVKCTVAMTNTGLKPHPGMARE
jgi:hypothetical protein